MSTRWPAQVKRTTGTALRLLRVPPTLTRHAARGRAPHRRRHRRDRARTATTSSGGCSPTAGRCTRRSATPTRPSAMFGAHERLRIAAPRPARPRPAAARSSATSGPRSSTTSPARAASAPRSPTRARPGSRTRTSSSHLLDAIRTRQPRRRASTRPPRARCSARSRARASSTTSRAALNPQSPYAAAKAAAHMLCRSYRESYGIRIACGILFNHESRRRGTAVPLPQGRRPRRRACARDRRRGRSRSATSRRSATGASRPTTSRGWSRSCARPRSAGVADEAALLPRLRPRHRRRSTPSGSSPTAPSRSPGFELDWELEGDDPLAWSARFADSGAPAVVVDPAFIRPSDPARDRRRPEPDRGRARLEAAAGPRPLPRRHARPAERRRGRRLRGRR